MKKCTKCGQSKETSMFPLCRGKLRSRCKSCHVKDAMAWANKNRDRYKANLRRAYLAAGPKNCLFPPIPDHIRKERIAAGKKKWASDNIDKLDSIRAAWLSKNKHIALEIVRRRQAKKMKATPAWSNSFFMREAYHLSTLRTKITGIKHEVDHIVPLQSKLVCGFHCEFNLQVIPRRENRLKHNRYWPDMPTG